jgi:hypothetical protein
MSLVLPLAGVYGCETWFFAFTKQHYRLQTVFGNKVLKRSSYIGDWNKNGKNGGNCVMRGLINCPLRAKMDETCSTNGRNVKCIMKSQRKTFVPGVGANGEHHPTILRWYRV